MSDSLRVPSPNTIIVHTLWPVEPREDTLTAAVWERLPSYLTRYAQTLGVTIYIVGGTADHAHLLLDLPTSKTLDGITLELQKAVGRFLKDSLSMRDFAWDRPAASSRSVGLAEFEALRDYIAANAERHAGGDTTPEWENEQADGVEESDTMPAWLRAAMPSDH